MNSKYSFPTWLQEHCAPSTYSKWLARKASAHRKRDRLRGNLAVTVEQYKRAIHLAVEQSEGKDFYTGRDLAWRLIGSYRNEESKTGKRTYKKNLGDLPSVDHIGDGLGPAEFRICAWRTNDAKNDLTHQEFIELCRQVIDHHTRAQI